ncbi:MAG: family 20 glycosylhydrolase, partial [Lentisphaerae bacterium]|nr:family 20 glycosylhydrolase [Lentisphaerota bacterium]
LATSPTALPGSRLAEMGLVPCPKQVNVLGKATVRGPLILLGEDLFPTSCRWLREDVRSRLGWDAIHTPPASGEGHAVRLVREALDHGPEAFRLELTSDGTTLTAAGEAGMFRAVGRLLRVLDSQASTFDGRVLRCPAMRIADWPDMALRGMHLQMAYRPEETVARDTIEVMAKLGLNMVGLEVGARFEYLSHPECSRRPWWTREQVRRLVALSKARGIMPIPCLNAIGHADRAPQVFMIREEDWQKRVMDLTHPDFYPTFLALLDELLDVFEKPPYVHVGTDEFSLALPRLCKLKGGKPHELYADFANRVTSHLKAKGARPVFWSDMLLRKSDFPGEPANASDRCPTDASLAMFTKDAIIDYWCYSPSPYRGLEVFREKGFTVWATPWYRHDGVSQLCQKARESGAAAILGSTWGHPPRVADAMVLTAEYAWNAGRTGQWVTYAPHVVGNELYCGRPSRHSPNVQPRTFEGGDDLDDQERQVLADAGLSVGRSTRLRGITFDLSNPRSFSSEPPKRLVTGSDVARAAANDETIFISPAPGLTLPADGVNKKRGHAETILYVADTENANTGTNRWGLEWTVVNGRVVGMADGAKVGGSSAIPTDGYVISSHRSYGRGGCALLRTNLKEGSQVQLLGFPKTKDAATATASLIGSHGVVVLLAARWSVTKGEDVGTLTVRTSDGGQHTMALKGNATLAGIGQRYSYYPAVQEDGWRLWPARVQFDANASVVILAYEWPGEGTRATAQDLRLTINPAGRRAGVIALAVSGTSAPAAE